jgi:UDP-glucose 4-epimerase
VRVLVTGGLGYVGSVVTAHLARTGHQVTALTRSRTAGPPLPAGVEVARGDLLDATRVAEVVQEGGFDGVCHLAGRTRIRESFADPAGYYQANLAATANLLTALTRHAEGNGQAARVVFASAGAIYGPAVRQPIDEETPPNPTSPYAASKLAAEELLKWQAVTGSIGVISLRCLVIAGAVGPYGDGDRSRLLPKTLAVAAGLEPCLQVNGDGSAVREFTHVADVAEAFRLALAAIRPGSHQVFNVGSGMGVAVRELVATVERITRHPVPIEYRPAANEPHTLILDSRRIRDWLGWRPRHSVGEMANDAWAWQQHELVRSRGTVAGSR